MHSHQLEAALTEFVDAVATQLRSALASGAEVQFELGAHGARGGAATPLYCYRALTREFIAERDAEIKRLPAYAETATLLEGFDGLDRYLVSVGIDPVRVKGRERARVALRALVDEVFDEQTDFEVRPERLQAALGRLQDAASARVSETVIVATLHGIAITSEELQLAKGLEIARRGAIAGLPDTTSVAATQREPAEHLLVVHRTEDEDPRAAVRHGCAILLDLLTSLRLFGDGRIVLGGVAWAQVGGGPWTPVPLGVSGRSRGVLVVTAEQEDELRAFCNLVSRRAPHGNDLAWALERFELGCERERALQGLSDHLLALRALLEPEGYWRGMLPGRLAALCAMPGERAALAERMSAAVELERAVVEGAATADSARRALAEEVAMHLKALLRDVVCGHLSPELAGFADELIAREDDAAQDSGEERDAEDAQADAPERAEDAAVPAR